mgnify:CR=1 FL=1
MDFVTTKVNLLRELELMQGIVEKKSTIPILSNIVIDARKDRLELLATDLEVGIRTSCEANVAKTGSVGVTASIGIATYPHDGRAIEDLMRRADEALYWVKSKGRDSLATYRRSMQESA